MTVEPTAFRIPLRLRFRGTDHRAGVLLRGPQGWGEWSPFPEYPPGVAARWLAAAREAATGGWPEPVRERVPVNAIVPAVAPDEAATIARRSGCATVKVKVAEPGQDPADDLARVEAVRDALGPGGRIRVDANAAWDVDTAARQLRRLARFDLEYAEQPVAALDDLRALRRRVGVPLAVDEAVRLGPDPRRHPERAAALRDAADVAVLKVQPLGGVRAALEIAAAVGLPAVVSSAVETSVGLAAGVALAAALPDLRHACGLGTASLLAGDVVADPLVPEGGWLAVRRPEPDPALLRRWAASPAEAARLLARLEAASAAATAHRGPP